jgi:hypothetical protein
MKKILFCILPLFVLFTINTQASALELDKSEKFYINSVGTKILLKEHNMLKDFGFSDGFIENITFEKLDNLKNETFISSNTKYLKENFFGHIVEVSKEEYDNEVTSGISIMSSNSSTSSYKTITITLTQQSTGIYKVYTDCAWSKNPANRSIDIMAITYPLNAYPSAYSAKGTGKDVLTSKTWYSYTGSTEPYNKFMSDRYNGGVPANFLQNVGTKVSAAAFNIPNWLIMTNLYSEFNLTLSSLTAGSQVCMSYKHNEDWVESNMNYAYLLVSGLSGHNVGLGQSSMPNLYDGAFSSHRVCTNA